VSSFIFVREKRGRCCSFTGKVEERGHFCDLGFVFYEKSSWRKVGGGRSHLRCLGYKRGVGEKRRGKDPKKKRREKDACFFGGKKNQSREVAAQAR